MLQSVAMLGQTKEATRNGALLKTRCGVLEEGTGCLEHLEGVRDKMNQNHIQTSRQATIFWRLLAVKPSASVPSASVDILSPVLGHPGGKLVLPCPQATIYATAKIIC